MQVFNLLHNDKPNHFPKTFITYASSINVKVFLLLYPPWYLRLHVGIVRV